MDADYIKHRIEHGNEYPYDSPDDWDGPRRPVERGDSATVAARAVLADLTDRRGIKWGFGEVDEDVRKEIVGTLAAIIREVTPPTPVTGKGE